MSNDYKAMMGGGVCWIDYNGDGWLDLFAVNSYSSADTARFEAHGGLPRTALYENVYGKFRNVSRATHADLPVQGDGCVAADLNGDGKTGPRRHDDVRRRSALEHRTRHVQRGRHARVGLVHGRGRRRRERRRAAGRLRRRLLRSEQSRARLARRLPDEHRRRQGSALPERGQRPSGHARFREVGIQAGLEAAQPRHGLGAQFIDYNFDGRPDLYVANDEDPNQLYANVPWPGGAKADPAGLGFRYEERGVAEGVADPFAGMGVASDNGVALNLFVTNSRHEPSAAYRLLEPGSVPAFSDARASVDPALGSAFAGWGASFVDLLNSGKPALVLTAGAIPVTNLADDAEPVRVLARVGSERTLQRYGDARGVLGASGLRLNGRGLAAADAGNDGRMDIAINTIGGKLVLLAPQGSSGHWLDVKLTRFSPGAVVTAELPDGRVLTREVHAGSSYLSSEDPRVHFGLGTATRVSELTVGYAWGGESRLTGVRADRIVEIAPPPPAPVRTPASAAPVVVGCSRSGVHGQSIARLWDETAVLVLRDSGAATPVQARDLFDLSAVMWNAYSQSPRAADRETAISYAAYRLLVWRASFDSNLSKTFALLTDRLHSLCYSPGFTDTAGDSPAALGNRIAAAAIAAGRHDGSLEALHYVDASYVPMNGPLVVSEAGSTVHDPTFWQPLALGQVAANGLAPIPAKIQSFVGAQWGHVRGFAKGLPDRSGAAALRRSVGGVVQASRGRGHSREQSQGNRERRLVSRGLERPCEHRARFVAAAGRQALRRTQRSAERRRGRGLRREAHVSVAATDLDDPLPRVPGAVERSESAVLQRGGLPLVPGLIELVTKQSSAPGQPQAALAAHVGQVAVLLQGRWVLGAGWTPPAATPASPGWVSERARSAMPPPTC